MGSMNYFGQVALEILEKNLLKSYFENLEIEILPKCMKFRKGEK